MKLSEYRKEYYRLSAKAGDVARQLAFAGIAIIWIFKLDSKPIPIIPESFLLPTILLACSLACDLLQYIVGTFIWGNFQWRNEKKKNDNEKNPDLTAPRYLNWPILLFFILKLSFLSLAYCYIIKNIIICWW
jgi:nicotinamide riboside transporter PnuC